MPTVQRFLYQQLPDVASRAGKPTPLSDYIDKRVVVILGSPGMGKTTELRQAAKQEADPAFCTVSQFLNDDVALYQGNTIFLDALDEHRAELHQGQTIINAIRGRLLSLGCPKVRISCRGEEWHQGSDVESLRPVASDEPVYILKMLPLVEEDIRAIASEKIEDVDTFLVGAKERQLDEVLGNPENLKLYLKVYKSTCSWPRTRTELMARSTELLVSEENERHERARGARISGEQLMRAAEDLSAILLFGDKEGAALNKPAGSDLYIPLQELPGIDLDAFDLVARRRLFSSDAPERVHPQHKTTGDYLAAKALVRRIQDRSLPLGRALSLVTGKDGAPLSHLRDVYAWLIALLPEHAERLVTADPFGALIYGDVAQWSVPVRRMALKHLSANAAKMDPWFRAGAWHIPLLGELTCPELIDDFRDILKHETSPHVTSVVLDTLEYGSPLPELGDDLLSFIRDPGRREHDWLRDDALRGFIRVCPERIDDRKNLLKEVKAGVVPDDDNLLRGVLLCDLYPVAVGPREVVHFFAAANVIGRGTMDWFIRRNLVDKTPEFDLPLLADAILSNPDAVRELHEFDRRKLNGKLVRRLLEVHGSAAAASQIYAWLGIYMDKYHTSHLDRKDADFIRDYFETHPELYMNLFRHWLEQAKPHEKHGYNFPFSDFFHRMLYAAPPRRFPEKLLKWVTEETDWEKAQFLFEKAADTIICGDLAAFSISFDDLFDYVEAHPAFTESFEGKRTSFVPDWKWQHARDKLKSRQKKNAKRATDIEILSPRLEALRTGRDLANLEWGAMNWLGLHISAENEKGPSERLQQQTNDQISEAFTRGFENLLKKDCPKTPSEIVKNYRKERRYFECFPVLAGVDIVAARSMEEFLALPRQISKRH